MGVGGNIRLVNRTPYDWAITMPKVPYQMNHWSFPAKIPSMGSETTYIEFGDKWPINTNDDSGNITISLINTPYNFELQARKINGQFTLQALLENMATANNAQGDMVRLGFERNGEVALILSGSKFKNFTMINLRAGNFAWGSVPQSWMQYNMETLGPRPLREICMPGTHNSGMSKQHGGTALVAPEDVLCQGLSVFGQLSAGARYLDIRPVKAGGAFRTGHYSNLGDVLKWQGMNGQSIAEIITDINKFTASNSELVILNVSHDLQTDQDYRSFTVPEWTDFFTLLLGLKNLYIRPSSTTTTLVDLPLSTFIGSGHPAVIVFTHPNVIPAGFSNRGFYPVTQMRIHDQYSNTSKADVMVNGQINEMRKAPKDSFFVLSWTLTQTDFWAVATTSIQQLAEEVNPMLYTRLLKNCTKGVFPNVLYTDYIKGDRNVAALAMTVNHIFAP